MHVLCFIYCINHYRVLLVVVVIQVILEYKDNRYEVFTCQEFCSFTFHTIHPLRTYVCTKILPLL